VTGIRSLAGGTVEAAIVQPNLLLRPVSNAKRKVALAPADRQKHIARWRDAVRYLLAMPMLACWSEPSPGVRTVTAPWSQCTTVPDGTEVMVIPIS